jgi:hypothetical protein
LANREDERRTERPAQAVRSRLRDFSRSMLGVLPACTAGALFAHMCWFGLRPALAERARLGTLEQDVEARHAALVAVESDLLRTSRALEDEIYRERLRRQFERNRRERALAGDGAAQGGVLGDPTWFGTPGELEALTRGKASPPAPSVASGGAAGPAPRSRNKVR